MINSQRNSINNISLLNRKDQILKQGNRLIRLKINEELIKDVRNIANGVYSPLKGFLYEEDFQNVVSEMRLANGMVWPIPIVLDVQDRDYRRIKDEKEILLIDLKEKHIALLKNIQIYSYDKDFFAKNVFGTLDKKHPGVEEIYGMGDYLVGGEVKLLDGSKELFPQYNFTPEDTRKAFQKRNWKTVVAFQTRNVPHQGHEFLQKQALQDIDGLFIQPVIGKKKLEDFKDEYILASYEILIERYYPKNKAILGILPLKMRYAGPREAIFHALIRKNYGCTHFIVGRDHAGVGGYYPPFAAQEIFDGFKKEEIGINILKFPEVVYCYSCRSHVFINSCRHKDKVSFSGTEIRNLIKHKKEPSPHIIRPEIYNLLLNSDNSLVDNIYRKSEQENKKGFVLWFTGFSQSGKTTVADKVHKILQSRGIKTERLDGDIVRQCLSGDLGFSKKDRDENIKRVGVISKLLSKNNIGVIASFISPYKKQRNNIRKNTNFIEVFCNCPLGFCEQRDKKGLYQKARNGEIKNFTGVSDSYEKPTNPEIELRTDIETIKESTQKVISYLSQNGYI